MLAKFRKAKEAEIRSLRELQASPGWQPPKKRARLDFGRAIAGNDKISVIAEYKRASPSKGRIRADLDVEEVASRYLAGGAAAMSILTEEDWFDGRLEYLDRAALATDGKLPILRKDFIFEPEQVVATAATSAAAILLITRFFEKASDLANLIQLAKDWDLAPVVEIFNSEDLAMARAAGAKIIQVNARDLQSLKVDRIGALKLAEKAQPDEIWIAASGISEPGHLVEAREAGFNAVLVGGALMAAPDPGEALAALINGGE